ncbi:MAG TPA: hypothetical protein VFR13_03090 [Jiangellaceae bacterium]|nr:hypothetical protein [Jiangellaceae bacterium]
MDPFDTAALRSRVLAAWAASPARFREDANAEDELVRGAYRDRLIVELAQNASDAAVRAGVPGRVLLRLAGDVLTAANTGAPLDAAGVEGLSTLRASAKRDEDPVATVGRFGVGFAAVLAVTDEPAILSSTGGVRWSRSEARAAAAGVPTLTPELARRGDAVPVLRLPYPTTAEAPAPYDTAVVLALRDDRARSVVADLLTEVGDALLLALPGLAEVLIEIDGARRVIAARWAGDTVDIDDDGVRTRWRLARRASDIAPALLADRPAEERARPFWAVTVAVPIDAMAVPTGLPDSVPRVVHAPTPTDDRTALPALVLATFPLDAARRRVAPGALTDMLVAEIGHAFAALARGLGGPGVLDLVPGPLGAGELDAALHRAVVTELASTPLVPAADGTGPIRPADVVLVPGLHTAADPSAVTTVVGGLPAAAWWRAEPLRRLGAREVPLSDVVDALGGIDLAPAQWRELYAALSGADLEALATLPVPLADGRVVRGPRGLLVPTGQIDPSAVAPLRLRIIAAAAVHPLLTRLGALDATPAAVLRDPSVRATVDVLADDEAMGPDDRSALVGALLHLVAAAGVTVEDEPWLARIPLPDTTGHPVPAGDLLVPEATVLDLLDADPAELTVAAETVQRWGLRVLRAVGVRDGFGTVEDVDVPLDGRTWHDLDDEDGWVASVLADLPHHDLPPVLVELTAVRDLDLVRDDAWPEALAVLPGSPVTRPAVVDPAFVTLDNGSRHTVEPYTAWWLRTHARIHGRRLREYCTADAEAAVASLLRPLEVGLDSGTTRALRLPSRLADVEPSLLLDRLADPDLELPARVLAQIYSVLATADASKMPTPDLVRVSDGTGSRVVAADSAVVADGPHWLQLRHRAVVPGPPALADVLGIDLAADVLEAAPAGEGSVVQVPDVVGLFLPGPPLTYVEHDDLVVAGTPVDWWVDADSAIHAASVDGLARGLCWAAGRWELRFAVAEAIRLPDAVPALLAEQAFDAGSAD